MTMKLNVLERVGLVGILPKEGDFTNLKLVRELREKIGFTPEENVKFGIVQKEGTVAWNEEGHKSVEIELEDQEKELIKEVLLGIDKSKKLTEQLFTVYEKFVQDKEEKSE